MDTRGISINGYRLREEATSVRMEWLRLLSEVTEQAAEKKNGAACRMSNHLLNSPGELWGKRVGRILNSLAKGPQVPGNRLHSSCEKGGRRGRQWAGARRVPVCQRREFEKKDICLAE